MKEKSQSQINRINRIMGQLEGISQMIKKRRDSLEISQQIAAVRSALAGLGIDVLEKDFSNLTKDKKRIKKILDYIFHFS